jgi:hypothetical protein
MEDDLYGLIAELGGMDIPLKQPKGGFNNLRLRSRGGEEAADFPTPFLVDESVNADANEILPSLPHVSGSLSAGRTGLGRSSEVRTLP